MTRVKDNSGFLVRSGRIVTCHKQFCYITELHNSGKKIASEEAMFAS